MDGFKPCPKCYSPVEVVVLNRDYEPMPVSYFIVNCKQCGEGTTKAYHSVSQLQTDWNMHRAELK